LRVAMPKLLSHISDRIGRRWFLASLLKLR
jgi:hypothetical protein